jgi:pimeloyl-ACP methyl ester carboxylesterase
MKLYINSIIIGLTAICITTNLGCHRIFSSDETIHFQSSQFNITGKLKKPNGEGPYPLVICVHGSGPAYHSYFSTVKKCILDAGYATLMWDKPGYGKSTGEFSKEHLLSERACILVDAIEKMRKHPEIDENRIGVWGISQAGYVIPRALIKTNDIAFMIMVGCPGELGMYQTAYQIRRQLECEGYSDEEARNAENHFIKIFEAESFEEYIKHAKPLYDNPVQRELGFVSALWDKTNWKPISKERETLLNPMDVIETVTIPALVFYGEKDTQVDPIQGKEAYQKAFHKSGNKNFRIEIIPNSDHNIILCETGSMKERSERSGKGWSNYAPEYLEIMGTWLKALK